MENDLNNADPPVTRAGLRAEFNKFEEKMEQLLPEQANAILEAVGETMEKKLDEKVDPVITKLDGIMKGVETLQQENTVGAQQLRRHEDHLQKHEARNRKARDRTRMTLFRLCSSRSATTARRKSSAAMKRSWSDSAGQSSHFLRKLRKANHRVPEESQASSAQDDRIAAPSDSSRNK